MRKRSHPIPLAATAQKPRSLTPSISKLISISAVITNSGSGHRLEGTHHYLPLRVTLMPGRHRRDRAQTLATSWCEIRCPRPCIASRMVLDASGRRALPVGGRSQHVPTNAPSIWDRYHARQDAYRETNRITQDCTKGVAYCDGDC